VTDLRSQLQSTLGDGYTLERELGGGGMSRVFVTRDNTLGRDVVVEVLASGASAGLPYYTMPFVNGESLRAPFDLAPDGTNVFVRQTRFPRLVVVRNFAAVIGRPKATGY
jgi:serine/threonine protein kinase